MKRVKIALTMVVVLLAILFPFIFGSGTGTALLEQIFAFGAFAMSYDLLIGYTGIVSFGHAMFFGTGAYAVAILLNHTNGSSGGFVLGFAIAIVFALVLSIMVAFLALRVRHAYFAMVTLAVGQVFYVLAGSQPLRPLTNSNDGITVSTPMWLNSDLAVYYFSATFLALMILVLRRFVKSPVGDVLRGIRENESRTRALGYSVFQFKTIAFMVSGVIAALAGGVYACVQSFVSTSVYDVGTVSLQVVLMTIIGGVGTLYGGLLGAAIVIVVQNILSTLAGTYPILSHAGIIFGVLYIIMVRFLPKGIIGTTNGWKGRWGWKSQTFKKSAT